MNKENKKTPSLHSPLSRGKTGASSLLNTFFVQSFKKNRLSRNQTRVLPGLFQDRTRVRFWKIKNNLAPFFLNKGFKPLVQKGLLLALLLLITHSSFIMVSSAMTITISSGNAGSGLVGHWPLSQESETTGSDLVSGWDFTDGWGDASGGTVVDSDTFSTTANGGTTKNYMTTGKRYRGHVVGTTTASSFSLLYTGNGSQYSEYLPTGAFDSTFEFTALSETVYLRNEGVGTTDITSFVLKEIQTADATPVGNDGAIHGATYTAGPTPKGLGENLATNGTFDVDSNWTQETGWTISDGTANCDGTNNARMWQASEIEIGKKYVITLDITNYISGGIQVYGATYYTIGTAEGSFSYEVTATNTTTLYIRSASFSGSIDNVSVREVVSGDAMEFDGVDDYVDIGDLGAQTNWTIGFWMYSNSVQGFRNPFHTHFVEESISNTGVRFEQYSDGEFKIGVSQDNVWRGNIIMTDLQPSTWYHVIAVGNQDADNLKVYVNGVKELDVAHTSWPTDFDNVVIGKGFSNNAERWFDGKLADVRLYDRALSLYEIQKLYSSGESKLSTGSANKGLVGHWPLNNKSVQSDSRSLDNSSAGTSYVASDQAYGTWEFDLYKGGSGNIYETYFISDSVGLSNTYSLEISADERIKLQRNGTSVVYTATSYVANNTWYRIKVTRTTDGEFTVSIKGGTFGDDAWTLVDVTGGTGTNPATDTTYTTSNYFVTDLDSGDKIRNVHTDNGFISVDKFTDGTGTTTVSGNKVVADTTPNANAGTVYGAEVRNQGYSFDGVNDYVDAGDVDILGGATEATWAAWVKPIGAGESEWQSIITTWNATTWVFDLKYQGLAVHLGGASGYPCHAGITGCSDFITYGEWTHVVATFDNGTLNYYANGIFQKSFATGLTSIAYKAANENLLIGGDRDGNVANFNGSISDARIYDRALSASEIQQLYNGDNVAAPLGHWPLDNGPSDISGNGNHGTVSGATLVGEATSFDGVDDYVDMGSEKTVSTGDASVSIWYKQNGTSGTTDATIHPFISANTINPFKWFSSYNNKASYWTNGATNYGWHIGTTDFSDGYWHNAILIFEVDTKKYSLYVDGTLESQSTDPDGIAETTYVQYIGRYSNSRYADGNLSDTRIYNRALSTTEITALYTKGHTKPSHASVGNLNKGLVGHWPLNNKSVQGDSRSLDNSSNGVSYVASSQAYGTWEFDLYNTAGEKFIPFISTSSGTTTGNGYDFSISTDRWFFHKYTNGITNRTAIAYDKTNASGFAINTWYTIKITRNSVTDEFVTGGVGTFALYAKGGSFGNDYTVLSVTSGTNPTTDNTYTTSSYFVADFRLGDKIRNIHTDNGFISVDKFTDGTGTTTVSGNKVVADTTPNANAGTVYGADVRNQGYSFDGVDDYIVLDDINASTTNYFTVSAKVTPDSLDATDNGIFGRKLPATAAYRHQIDFNNETTLRYYARGLSPLSIEYTITPSDFINKESIITFVRNGTSSTFYVNGVQVYSATQTGTPTYSFNLIGSALETSQYFNGNIADARIYDRALSASEIQQLYNGDDVASPVAHWPLDNGSGDISGNGNHGTVSGATLVGEAASFDGVSDYIALDVQNQNLSGDQTLSAWIKGSSDGPHGTILCTDTEYQSGVKLMNYYHDNRVGLWIGNGSSANDPILMPSVNVNDNQWHFISGTYDYDAGTVTTFVDGQFYSPVTIGQYDATPANGGMIAKEYHGFSNNYGFGGNIVDTRIYNRSLSTTEIQQLYNQGRP